MGALADYPRITPFLWFDSNAEEAVDFYLSVFPNSKRLEELRNPDDSQGKRGSILTIAFELAGQKFTALNGGPHFKFTEAISFVVRCESQQEIDDYWSKLGEGGMELGCGWIKDRFGLCWQIVPLKLYEVLRHPAAMRAMMTMKKFDIAALQEAARQA